jgi:uncharacterized protein (DUF952 family)
MSDRVAIVYKIVSEEMWRQAGRTGIFSGSADDFADGFIHLSARDQVAATAARHFSGHGDLLLVAICKAALVPNLRWEVSRQGVLFPHLYADLRLDSVLWVKPLPLGPDDRHAFPDLP